MEIRCKKTKRFLVNVNIENYYENLKKMGVDITTPIIIEIPCSKCKMVEVYAIYPDNYVLVKEYKHSSLQNK